MTAHRVLVVDDQPVVANLIRRHVQAEGHLAVTACSIEAALSALEREQFDLVFLDFFMENGRTGLEVFQRRPRNNIGATYIIMSGVGSLQAAHATGAAQLQYFEKPISPTALRVMLAGYLAAVRPPIAQDESRPASSLGDQHTREAVRIIERGFRDPDLRATIIASKLGLSADYLNRVFATRMNQTLAAFLNERRILEAKRLLKETVLPIKEIAGASGYHSTLQLERHLNSSCGQSPRDYRLRAQAR